MVAQEAPNSELEIMRKHANSRELGAIIREIMHGNKPTQSQLKAIVLALGALAPTPAWSSRGCDKLLFFKNSVFYLCGFIPLLFTGYLGINADCEPVLIEAASWRGNDRFADIIIDCGKDGWIPRIISYA